MTSQTGQEIIKIHILHKLGRIKGSQTMKLGQIIDRNTRNIFIEKSYSKCGREASPRLLYKKLKSSISMDQQPEML